MNKYAISIYFADSDELTIKIIEAESEIEAIQIRLQKMYNILKQFPEELPTTIEEWKHYLNITSSKLAICIV